jgi:hypothetical protein
MKTRWEKPTSRNRPRDDTGVGIRKDFKDFLINIFKDLKENMYVMSEPMGNLNRKIKTIKGVR